MAAHECTHGPAFVFLRQERRKEEFGSGGSRVVVEDIFFCQHCLHHERRTVREWEEVFEAGVAE